MRLFGLIGYPLEHSFSKRYFENKFHNESIPDTAYENFPLQSIDLLPELLEKNPDLEGLNVTIPYKETVIRFLNSLDDTANKIGAVNTIKIHRNTTGVQLDGFNTDVYGFRESLLPFLKKDHKKALVLGSGGAAKAVMYALEELGITSACVSRKPENNRYISYSDLDRNRIRDHLLIINTTPLGMFPNVDGFPDIPYEYLTSRHLLFDLVYNPETTRFMEKGQNAGAKALNGKKMLELQAEKSWELWNSECG